MSSIPALEHNCKVVLDTRASTYETLKVCEAEKRLTEVQKSSLNLPFEDYIELQGERFLLFRFRQGCPS